MIAFLSFLIVILGAINWMLIGLLQYDFVAGIFGYQGSIFSRLIYIFVGIAALYLIFKAFKDKGKINIINFKFSFKKKKATNIEVSKEFAEPKHEISGADYSDSEPIKKEDEPPKNNIFDEL